VALADQKIIKVFRTDNLNSHFRELAKTPIKVEALKRVFANYPNSADKQILLDCFQYGFRVQYDGPRLPFNCKNLVSAYQLDSELEEKLAKELSLGRIEGPFEERPFQNFRVFPIGLVPKTKTIDSSWRLIHHLSYPIGRSVTDFIDPEFTSVQYTSFDKVLQTISKLGQNALLAKIDILSAFRLMILHPDDFEIFGFKFRGKYYFDKCLPMGCSASCAFFKFAYFREWRLKIDQKWIRLSIFWMIIYWRENQPPKIVKKIMSVFRGVCDNLGVLLAEEKTKCPTCVLVYLGLVIDTIEMVIRIPENKLEEVKSKLLSVCNKHMVTLHDLQSLVVSLNFCSRAIPVLVPLICVLVML
jgi:hypothetical protein